MTTAATAVEVVEAYGDGGLFSKNPSTVGGAFAWCHVGASGEYIREGRGYVLPQDVGLDTVTNNVTELLALVFCLEALPDGWSGRLYTDSYVTLCRVRQREPGSMKKAGFAGVPDRLRDRVFAQQSRLGFYSVHLLGGHPTPEELIRGKRFKDDFPVSKHNVRCDEACNAVRAAFEAGNPDPGWRIAL